MPSVISRTLFGLLAVFYSCIGHAQVGAIATKQISSHAHSIDVRMIIFYACIIIGLLVIAALFYALIRFRRIKGIKTEHFHRNLLVEVLWTAIPLLILIGLMIPAAIMLMRLHHEDEGALDVEITAVQKHWQYHFKDQRVSLRSKGVYTPHHHCPQQAERTILLPTEQKINVYLTSTEGYYLWSVPKLHAQWSAVPNIINKYTMKIKQPGLYYSPCGVAGGIDANLIPVTVKAVPKATFKQWLEQQQSAK